MFESIQYSILTSTLKLAHKFATPKDPTLFEGNGSIIELSNLIKANNHKHLLIITTAGMIKKNLLSNLTKSFEEHGIKFSYYDGVVPNPTLAIGEEATQAYFKNGCDGVVAFGGGSVIDIAKAVALQIANNKPMRKLVGSFKGKNKPVAVYTVPTTSGTGSEITSASVLIDEENSKKVFVFDHKMIPTAVALDPAPLLGLPASLTAETGMDALTHAIECYLSRIDKPELMDKAAQAVNMIFSNLPLACEDGSNIEARTNMSKASYLAGQAFNVMGLGFVHALSHQFSALYNTGHGRANAVILPHVLRVSSKAIYPKLAKLAKESQVVNQALDDKQAAKLFIEKIEALLDQINLKRELPELKVEDIPLIIKKAKQEARNAYPVSYILTKKDCEQVLKEL